MTKTQNRGSIIFESCEKEGNQDLSEESCTKFAEILWYHCSYQSMKEEEWGLDGQGSRLGCF